MTTSGTYLFEPNTGELLISAFGRIGIKRADITSEMLIDGQRESNYWLVSAANQGPNLWTVDLLETTCIQSQATYDVDPSTVMMLDVYIRTTDSGQTIDRIISPLSRTNYAGIPDKAQEAPPTSYWFDRLDSPTVTLWPVPDDAGPYTLRYYRFRQMQDSNLTNGQTADITYLFIDAFVAGLAHRLSRYYAPTLEMQRKADADQAWAIATTQNTEMAPLSLAPRIGSYYR